MVAPTGYGHSRNENISSFKTRPTQQGLCLSCWVVRRHTHEANMVYPRSSSRLAVRPSLDGWYCSRCTDDTPGIEIISVRVTKPRIPEQIRGNFEKVCVFSEISTVSSIFCGYCPPLLSQYRGLYGSWCQYIVCIPLTDFQRHIHVVLYPRRTRTPFFSSRGLLPQVVRKGRFEKLVLFSKPVDGQPQSFRNRTTLFQARRRVHATVFPS